MQEKPTQQMWADSPDDLAAARNSWLQNVENARRQNLRIDGVPIPLEEFGLEWVERISWFLPLAVLLKSRASESEALSNHSACYDKYALCLVPNQKTSSDYWVMCDAVGPDRFQVTSIWRDYLQTDSEGKLKVVRAGTQLLFAGNAEDTADYLVRMVESWKSSEPPLP